MKFFPLILASAVTAVLTGINSDAIARGLNHQSSQRDSNELLACGGGGSGGGPTLSGGSGVVI